MPTLAESLAVDKSTLTPVNNPSITLSTGAPQGVAEPTSSPFTRCPLPILSSSTSDALRTYYTNGVVPQTRLLNPTINQNPAGTVAQSVTNVTQVTNTTTANPTTGWTSGSNSNGNWEKNPIGTIRQWGYISTDINGGTLAVTFPIPFPTACQAVLVTTESVNDRITYVDGTASLTGFTIGNNGSAGFAYWEATGN